MVDNGELTNRRVYALAKAHKTTVARVNEALDQHPVSTERETFLRRTLALELMRLDQLEMAFEDKALKDKDVSSGALLVKIAERRQILLGLAAPQGNAVMVHSPPPAQQQSSTDRIYAAIERIRNMKMPDEPPPNGEAE